MNNDACHRLPVSPRLLVDGIEVRRGLPDWWLRCRVRRWENAASKLVSPEAPDSGQAIWATGWFQILVHGTDGDWSSSQQMVRSSRVASTKRALKPRARLSPGGTLPASWEAAPRHRTEYLEISRPQVSQ